MIDADVDPAHIPPEVVGALGDRLADAGIREVVDLHLLGVPRGLPLPPAVLEVADQFLLLRVHGDDRPPGGEVAAAGLRRGDIGSPRVSGAISSSRAARTAGLWSRIFLRPPPGRRTRPAGGGGASSCFNAFRI